MANTQPLLKDTRQAMFSQFLGFGLDAYDMAMVVVMAPILTKLFISPGGSLAWQYTKILLLYSITMAARPVGSAFFGHYADKIGRRWLLVVTIAGVGVMSVLAGFLPTYAQVGAWSYLIFSLLRFLMGCFFGGEYAVGHTFAIEHAPRARRGAIAGFVQSGFPLAMSLPRSLSLCFPISAAMPACFGTAGASLSSAAWFPYSWRSGFGHRCTNLPSSRRRRRAATSRRRRSGVFSSRLNSGLSCRCLSS